MRRMDSNRNWPVLTRSRQTGIATLEFALLMMLGLLPLLLLTFSGVLIFAAKQSLTLASSEGARAALRYGTNDQRVAAADAAARRSMRWLLDFGTETAALVTVTGPALCTESTSTYCYTVTTRYNYNEKPLLPGTGALYGWALSGPIVDSATAQLDVESAQQLGLP